LKIKTPHIIFLISALFIFQNSFASPQVPDYLIYKNDTIPIYNLILEKYLKENQNSDKGRLFGLSFREGSTPNCWRGYQAVYVIKNDSIFLENIFDHGELYSLFGKKNIIDSNSISISKTKMKSIFKDKIKSGRVFIDWLKEDISIRNGSLLRWDGIFHKIFEQEILFRVKNGIVTNVKKIENYIDEQENINRRYRAPTSTILFEELKKMDWKKLDKHDCSEEYTIVIGKKGKVTGVSMTAYKEDEIDEMWDRKEYNFCIKNILKGLKNLEFDIIKRKGKRISEKIYLELWYEEKTGNLENWTN